MDGKLHLLDPHDEYIRFTLCYPFHRGCDDRIISGRLGFLSLRGVRYLIESGKDIMGFRVLGKGYSSIIVKALHRSGDVIAVKIRRLDSRRGSLELEGMVLDYLQPLHIVPRIYFWGKDVIGMEYIECESVVEYLKRMAETSLKKFIKVLVKMFSNLYILDLFQIDHGELNRPHGHMFWCGDHLKIIDWESARYRVNPHNLTMFASYIFIRSSIVGIIDKDRVIGILKVYKYDKTRGFKLLLDLLGSHEFSSTIDRY